MVQANVCPAKPRTDVLITANVTGSDLEAADIFALNATGLQAPISCRLQDFSNQTAVKQAVFHCSGLSTLGEMKYAFGASRDGEWLYKGSPYFCGVLIAFPCFW